MTDAPESADELEQRIAELEKRLERMSGGREQETAYWAILESILPADARRHLRSAGREQLLAARSMLDAWIARIDRPSDDQATRRETITVE
ncbi:MAG: hypothetical protein M3295_00180 [Chloroflexota bacterium]|nr:hypothetical protein [Chloroflexota bacterium]